MVSKFDQCKSFLQQLHGALRPGFDCMSISWFSEERCGTVLSPSEFGTKAIGEALAELSCGGGTKLILGLQEVRPHRSVVLCG